MTEKIPSMKRLFAEGVVIFLGVSAGFLADDFRDFLNDRRQETAILEQLIEDLALDSVDIAQPFESSVVRRDAMRWLARVEGSVVDVDSVSSVINGLGEGLLWGYEPSAFTYSALRASGDLQLIRDPALRDAIVFYYESRQPMLVEVSAQAREAEMAWREALVPHVRVGGAELRLSYPPVEIRDPQLLLEDAEFRHRVVLMGSWFGMHVSASRRVLELNRELRTAITAESRTQGR